MQAAFPRLTCLSGRRNGLCRALGRSSIDRIDSRTGVCHGHNPNVETQDYASSASGRGNGAGTCRPPVGAAWTRTGCQRSRRPKRQVAEGALVVDARDPRLRGRHPHATVRGVLVLPRSAVRLAAPVRAYPSFSPCLIGAHVPRVSAALSGRVAQRLSSASPTQTPPATPDSYECTRPLPAPTRCLQPGSP